MPKTKPKSVARTGQNKRPRTDDDLNGPAKKRSKVENAPNPSSNEADEEWTCSCGVKWDNDPEVWVGCDNPDCGHKGYHLRCTDLSAPPPQAFDWFCNICKNRPMRLGARAATKTRQVIPNPKSMKTLGNKPPKKQQSKIISLPLPKIKPQKPQNENATKETPTEPAIRSLKRGRGRPSLKHREATKDSEKARNPTEHREELLNQEGEAREVASAPASQFQVPFTMELRGSAKRQKPGLPCPSSDQVQKSDAKSSACKEIEGPLGGALSQLRNTLQVPKADSHTNTSTKGPRSPIDAAYKDTKEPLQGALSHSKLTLQTPDRDSHTGTPPIRASSAPEDRPSSDVANTRPNDRSIHTGLENPLGGALSRMNDTFQTSEGDRHAGTSSVQILSGKGPHSSSDVASQCPHDIGAYKEIEEPLGGALSQIMNVFQVSEGDPHTVLPSAPIAPTGNARQARRQKAVQMRQIRGNKFWVEVVYELMSERLTSAQPSLGCQDILDGVMRRYPYDKEDIPMIRAGIHNALHDYPVVFRHLKWDSWGINPGKFFDEETGGVLVSPGNIIQNPGAPGEVTVIDAETDDEITSEHPGIDAPVEGLRGDSQQGLGWNYESGLQPGDESESVQHGSSDDIGDGQGLMDTRMREDNANDEASQSVRASFLDLLPPFRTQSSPDSQATLVNDHHMTQALTRMNLEAMAKEGSRALDQLSQQPSLPQQAPQTTSTQLPAGIPDADSASDRTYYSAIEPDVEMEDDTVSQLEATAWTGM